MKLHRFYVGSLNLDDELTIANKILVWQWAKVLRLHAGNHLLLFNSAQKESVYEISSISKSSSLLRKLNDLPAIIPSKRIVLFWSLLKRDNNELILQKCSELGVSAFVPLITGRTIKKDFNVERAQKIVIEASEQCGRADIPKIANPTKIKQAIMEHKSKIHLLVADQSGSARAKLQINGAIGILIGPEGGWTDTEINFFESLKLQKLKISGLTLRAETAAIVAASKLL